MTDTLVLREAKRTDVPLILDFIRQLAEYERLSDKVVATEELLHHFLFGNKAYAEVILAQLGDEPVGFALFFHNFSTFLSKPGIYLEDLFVTPQARGKGIGKALMKRVAQMALERGCARFEWAVLDWNDPAIEFYRSVGAMSMDEWTVQRVTGDALVRLAEG